MTTSSPHNTVRGRSLSPEADKSNILPATVKADKRHIMGSRKQERRGAEEDDLPAEDDMQPPGLLREIDEDGNERIISDHSTSAAIIFQNTLVYELD